MENKTALIMGIFVLASLLGSTYYISEADQDKAYYCESKGLVGICEKLSGGSGTRCYYNETYKVCPEGWQKMTFETEVNSLCYTEGEYTYCCESKQMSNGACDWIIRR